MSAIQTRFTVAAAGLVAAGILAAACSPSSTASTSSASTTSSSSSSGFVVTPQLWGEMKPIVSVKELMRDMIDPIADNIFDAIAVIVDRKGAVEHSPKNDEEWAKVRIGGVTMAEGSYLLKVRTRPWTPKGDENNTTGPEAVELTPAQITAKVEKDPVEWNARIEALRNVGLQVMDIVDRKATQELWDASENLDAACEACHKSYWYPGETSDYYRRLDRRMREHNYPGGKTKDPEPEK
jgi:hypothetical protein